MNHRSVLLPLGFSVLFFIGAALITIPLDENYQRDELVLPVSASAGVPADVLLLQQSLGAFRGWAINALWLKAIERREQGELHESMELARWILKLQPYFPRVWNFQSWLLAFELAFDTRDPEERWDWVGESIDLLRGEGLRANPMSREIHRQLSYLFWFKLGESRDDASPFFREKLFEQWQRLLGPGGTDPASQAKLLRNPDARLRLDLVDKFNMDPQLMAEISEQFPGLDWRVPGSHAIYWAVQGLLRQETGEILPRLTEELYAQVLLLSHVRIGLQQLIVRGRPVVDSTTQKLITSGPVPELLPVFLRSLEELGDGQIPSEFSERAREIVTDTALQAWLLGDDALTLEILERLKIFGDFQEEPNESLIDRLALIVLDKLDPGEPVTMISILIRARGLIASAGGGLEVEFTRGLLLADLLESNLSSVEKLESQLISISEALRSPRASAPLPIKQRIWQRLPAELRKQIDDSTKSVLRDDARKSEVDPLEIFPGM